MAFGDVGSLVGREVHRGDKFIIVKDSQVHVCDVQFDKTDNKTMERREEGKT
jgi:hypothetical protein